MSYEQQTAAAGEMACGCGEAQERARSSRTKGDAMRAAASFSEGDNVGGALGRRL